MNYTLDMFHEAESFVIWAVSTNVSIISRAGTNAHVLSILHKCTSVTIVFTTGVIYGCFFWRKNRYLPFKMLIV